MCVHVYINTCMCVYVYVCINVCIPLFYVYFIGRVHTSLLCPFNRALLHVSLL